METDHNTELLYTLYHMHNYLVFKHQFKHIP